jgi:hypothetical protein
MNFVRILLLALTSYNPKKKKVKTKQHKKDKKRRGRFNMRRMHTSSVL